MATRNFQTPPPDAQIDWSHPITRDLVIGLTGHNTYSIDYGAISGIAIANNGTVKSTVCTGKKTVDYYEANGVNGNITFPNLKTSDNFTIVACLSWDGAGGGGYSTLWNNTQGEIRCAGKTVLHLSRKANVTAARADITIPSGYADEWHVYGFHFPNTSVTSDIEGYIDGIQQSLAQTVTGSGTINYSYGHYSHVIFGNAANSTIFDGRFKFFYYWKRRLSPSEHKMLSDDPFCFYTWQGKKSAIDNVDLQNFIYADAAASLALTTSSTGNLTIRGIPVAALIQVSSSLQTVSLGSATGTISITSSALGGFPLDGSATASLTVTTSASTFKQANASANSSVVFSTSATPTKSLFGTATSIVSLTSSATPFKILNGAATSAVIFQTSGTATRILISSATNSLAFSTSANGFKTLYGSASNSITLTSSTTALKILYGIPTPVQFTISTSADAKATYYAMAETDIPITPGDPPVIIIPKTAAPIVFTSTATALKTISASAASQIAINTAATISGILSGQSSAQIQFNSSATGLKTLIGTATANISINSDATGLKVLLGNITANITITSSNTATLVLQGATQAQIQFATSALIDSGIVISFVDDYTIAIEWDKSIKANISPIEEYILPIDAEEFNGR